MPLEEILTKPQLKELDERMRELVTPGEKRWKRRPISARYVATTGKRTSSQYQRPTALPTNRSDMP